MGNMNLKCKKIGATCKNENICTEVEWKVQGWMSSVRGSTEGEEFQGGKSSKGGEGSMM